MKAPESPPRILVALATTRHNDAVGPRAVAEARERGGVLVLLLVREDTEIERVFQLRFDGNVLGARPVDELLHEIVEEHARILREQADEIVRLATDSGVPVEQVNVSGRYEAEVARAAAEGKFAVLFWLRQNRGFMARFFLGADEDVVVRVEPTRGGGE